MRLCAITDEISQDLQSALGMMAEFGCRDVELRNAYGTYLVDADEALLARVQAEIKERGMRVACIDTPFFKCDMEGGNGAAAGTLHGAPDRALDEQMQMLNRAIDLCKRFDSPFIRIFSFWKKGPISPEVEDRIADLMVRPAEVAHRAGVTLLLENEHACYLGTGKEAARVIEKVGSPALKMIWDPGNGFMAGEQPFPSGYQAALPHIAHIHIKDARVGDDGKLEWTVVGEGEIDYVGQFKALKESGYEGCVSLETHYRAPDGNQDAASRKCLDAMKRLIEA